MVTFIAADMVRKYRIKLLLFKVNFGNYIRMADINRTVIKTHLETTIIKLLSLTNRPWEGRGQGHVTNFRILHPLEYLWNGWIVRDVKFCVAVGYRYINLSYLALGQLIIPERGVARVTWPLLEFLHPMKYLENG